MYCGGDRDLFPFLWCAMLTYSGGMISLDPSLLVSAKRAAPASNWWPSSAIAAWQAKGAASQAASYVNLVSPGTHDLTPGVAPTWDSANGWKWNGATQYLKTGITPSSLAWSVLIRYSGMTSEGADRYPCGAVDGAGIKYSLAFDIYSLQCYFCNGSYTLSGYSIPGSGVLGISQQRAFINGVYAATIPVGSGAPLTELFVGASSLGTSPFGFFDQYIQSATVIPAALSDGDVATYSAAMAAL